jgi:hypothetical protein
MRNFDAFAVALIAIILLGFSEIHLTPQPFQSAVRLQQAGLRQQIREQLRAQLQVLKCPNR